MSPAEFYNTLGETGGYKTARMRRKYFFGRMLENSDFWYYFKNFAAIFRGYVAARRGRFDKTAWIKCAHDILRAIESRGGEIDISGMEHVLKLKAPAVYVANHMSVLETMLLPGAIILPFHDVAPIVKESLLRYPFFGAIMRAIKPISVGRQNPRRDFQEVLTNGREFLGRGRSVLVFPQATRHVEFDPSEFNTLGIKLARQACVPVVPVALKTDFHGVGRIFRDIGRIDKSKTIHFKFGASIEVRGNGKDAHDHVVRFIAENLIKWGGTVITHNEKHVD